MPIPPGARFRQEVQKSMITIVQAHAGITQSQLAGILALRFGVSPEKSSKYLEELIEWNHIERREDGGLQAAGTIPDPR